jgi:hypothetical protein
LASVTPLSETRYLPKSSLFVAFKSNRSGYFFSTEKGISSHAPSACLGM